MLRLTEIKLLFGHLSDTQQVKVLAMRGILSTAVDDIEIVETEALSLSS